MAPTLVYGREGAHVRSCGRVQAEGVVPGGGVARLGGATRVRGKPGSVAALEAYPSC
ncbi:hypothetical protein ES288_D04G104100v1 [Gossypium darwinii]|uniref:Uncharacterized protein n=2 Tax=Gossypium TaxID=3633 RepID=A0A5D2LBK9_GOSTO|nr:hypothetical protein ES288_D04G104100v1 [Gossypium darwinii]TYH76697.1 hypothetical protein ES332_D04G104300v1 [Gossypium tomentosum]